MNILQLVCICAPMGSVWGRFPIMGTGTQIRNLYYGEAVGLDVWFFTSKNFIWSATRGSKDPSHKEACTFLARIKVEREYSQWRPAMTRIRTQGRAAANQTLYQGLREIDIVDIPRYQNREDWVITYCEKLAPHIEKSESTSHHNIPVRYRNIEV